MAKSSSKKTSKPKDFDPREPLPTDAPYFYSLTLENIRCFADKQTLDLSDGNGNAARWTVILGENGTGKTTILQALAMLQPEKDFTNDLDDTHLKSPIKRYSANLTPVSITNFPLRFDSYSTDQQGKITGLICIGTKDKVQLLFDISFWSQGFGIGHSLLLEDTFWAERLIINGYGAKRHIGVASWEKYRSTNSTTSIFEPTTELINAAEWLRSAKLNDDLTSTFKKNEKISTRYDKIVSLLKSGVLPKVDDVAMRPSKQSSGVEVIFHTPDGWIPLESLGLGYQTMIAWTVDFAARMVERYPDSDSPLLEPAIVLVDELDLHLHPRWQREIIGFLTKQFPKTQFIVTAHSPLVVQAAQDVNANIVLLRREGDHVVIDQNVRIDRNLTADQLLTSEVFGLTALYSPKTEEKLAEQAAILSKPTLTATDKKLVKKLEHEIGVIPTAQSQEDRDAMALIRRAATLMQKNGMTSKKGSPKAKTKRKVSNGTH